MEDVAGKIPDIWNDFYTRLVPGATFLSSLLYISGRFPDSSSIANGFWILVAGYIIGQLIYPAASRLGRLVEIYVGQTEARNRARGKFSATYRDVLVISKVHAEMVGMSALALFSAILLLVQWVGLPIGIKPSSAPGPTVVNNMSAPFLFLCIVFFVLMTIERAFDSKRRWLELENRTVL